MKTRTVLQAIVRAVSDEADSNPEFDAKLRRALQLEGTDANPPRRRRCPAALDPVKVARSGEPLLRQKLEELSIEQLKDIVSHYAMDPDKLVMKWKTKKRIVDRIVSMSMQRATKGDAFRG